MNHLIAILISVLSVTWLVTMSPSSSTKPGPAPIVETQRPGQTYVATVISVHDGDTFRARVELGMEVSVTSTFRVNGVDCPELSTEHGKRVRDRVREAILNKLVVIRVISRGKYGRWLADVEFDQTNLAKWLIEAGDAKPYFGRGPKPKWGE